MAPSVIIIGAGPSGIAMAHQLQSAGVKHFTIYEASDGAGGVWHLTKYPQLSVDIHSCLYSFSFNQSANWTQELAQQSELERYMEDTVDKLGLRPHIQFQVFCHGAAWDERNKKWRVKLQDCKTKETFEREADVFVSCVGAISVPKDCAIPGYETFTGTMWHSARWNHEFDVKGKRVAVIGNGCSAAQFVPALVNAGAQVKQYARSPQWYHERPNHQYSKIERLAFKTIPGLMRLYRLYLFLNTDKLLTTYLNDDNAQKVRAQAEIDSRRYMEANAPAKYHKQLLPTFPLGCKRRIFDPGYLACLHSPNIELLSEGIDHIEGATVVSASGRRDDYDAIVLATGYKVQEFLTPLSIVGENGMSLSQHWKETRGAQAYHGTFVSGFPNFAIIFGPNSFPAHNSVIFTAEVQCEFTRKALIEPLIFGKAETVNVKQAAEDRNAQSVQIGLKGTVWEAGCANWYLNEWGRNTASYPGYASSYWFETFFPNSQDFEYRNKSLFWPIRAVVYRIRRHKKLLLAVLAAALLRRQPGLISEAVTYLWRSAQTILT
ncbi:hypothetical protein OIO90_003780 [Microbotryomycetes sp. JL221]|nr:hypothetical protein OIO90_003780 [Microbotryomycetes sp. JL221]